MNINERFLQTVRKSELVHAGDKVICACSGGPDSVLLLHLFYINKDVLHIDLIGGAHLNHALRNTDAKEDERFVENLCKSYNITAFTDTAVHIRDRHNNPPGSEAWGRSCRREFFERLSLEQGAVIATGHTASDAAETVLFRLIRGSSAAGLLGMKPKSGYYIRPLINCTRNDVMQAIAQYKLSYRIDSSNNEDIYARNIIRNKVIPILCDINPGAPRAMINAAKSADVAQDFVKQTAKRYILNGEVELREYAKLHIAVQNEIVAQLIQKHCELSADFVAKARAVMLKKNLALQLCDGARLVRRDGKAMIFCKK